MLIELALRKESYIGKVACFEPTFERAHVRLSMMISPKLRAKALSGERTGKSLTFKKSSSIMVLQGGTVAFRRMGV